MPPSPHKPATRRITGPGGAAVKQPVASGLSGENSPYMLECFFLGGREVQRIAIATNKWPAGCRRAISSRWGLWAVIRQRRDLSGTASRAPHGVLRAR